MKNILLLIFILIGTSYSIGQEVTYEKVKKQFESFEYDNVIKLSDQLIAKGNLNDSLMIDVYIMRAIIFYEKDELETRKTFENILKIKKNYSPNPFNLSPQLIAIFNEVKSEYYRNNPDPLQPKELSQAKQEIKFLEPPAVKNAVIKNFFLPGLGQIQFGNSTKGWLTASLFTLNLGAMIYTVIDTKNKEDAYLNESNEFLIQQKYDEYNKSYKLRNIFVISCAAIWLYSQLDFLFFSDTLDSNNAFTNVNIHNSSPITADFQLSFKIPF